MPHLFFNSPEEDLKPAESVSEVGQSGKWTLGLLFGATAHSLRPSEFSRGFIVDNANDAVLLCSHRKRATVPSGAPSTPKVITGVVP